MHFITYLPIIYNINMNAEHFVGPEMQLSDRALSQHVPGPGSVLNRATKQNKKGEKI